MDVQFPYRKNVVKSLVSALSKAVSKAPAWVIIAVVLVTLGLGYFNAEVVQDAGNEGFAPDAPELDASERIGELFGDESSGTVLQIIVSSDDGDVITAEGRETVRLITEAVNDSVVAERLQVGNGPGSVVSFLAPIEGGGASDGPTAQIVISSDSGDVVTPDGLAASAAVQQAVFSSPAAAKLSTEQPPVLSFLAPLEGGGQGPTATFVISSTDGDAITSEGLTASLALQEGIFSTSAAAKIPQDGEQPPITSYLLPIESAVAQGQADPTMPTDALKQVYLSALDSLPPEVAGFLPFLSSNDADLAIPQAGSGLINVTLTEPLTPDEDAAFAELAASIDLADGYSVTYLPAAPSAEAFKSVYQTRSQFLPAEVAPFLAFLLSNDVDPSGPTASKGSVIVNLSEELTADEQASLADAIASADLPAGITASYLPDDASTAQLKQSYLDQAAFIPGDQGEVIQQLLSSDRDMTAPSAGNGLMILFFDQAADEDDILVFSEEQTALVAAINELDLPDGLSAEAFSFELIFASGGDATSEIGRMFGLALAIILVILVFNFWVPISGRAGLAKTIRRALAGTFLTLLTILMAITWMQGLGVLGGPKYLDLIGNFNQIVQILPILLIGLGVDYGIHMVSRYQEEVAAHGVSEAITVSIRTVGVALVLATITTAVGFLTNLVSPIPALKDFGILAAIGIFASFFLMLTFVPAIRFLLDRGAEKRGTLPVEDLSAPHRDSGVLGPVLAGLIAGVGVYALSIQLSVIFGDKLYADLFEVSDAMMFGAIGGVIGFVLIWLPKIVGSTAAIAKNFAVATVIVAVALAGVGEFGRRQLSTEFSFTDFVPRDNPLLGALNLLIDEFGGGFGETTNLLVEGDVATPDTHNALVDAWIDLGEEDDILVIGDRASATSALGLLDTYLTPGVGFNPDVAAAAAEQGVGDDLRVPDSADVAALYDAVRAVDEASFDAVMHSEGGSYDAALWVVGTQAGDSRVPALRDALNSTYEPVRETGVTVIPTSDNLINRVVVESLQDSQTRSLGITLAAATLLLVLNFWIESRRPLLGIITMLPVGLVVLLTFGMMALTDIPFGPVTATISALAIGIGVPYTIHITHRFQEDRIRFESVEDAVQSTMRHTGGALAGSALTTMAGFGSLVTSNLTPFQQFGAVTFYAIGFALLMSILVLPSMLVLWDRWHRNRGDAVLDEAALHKAFDV